MRYIFLLGVFIVGMAQAGSPGGTDSCGFGWEIVKGKSLGSTSVRATTNAVLPPTFSMTSGTSGCDKHGIVKNEFEAVRFAVANLDPLMMEVSQGEGEYLESFAQTLRCDGQGNSQLAVVLKSHYSNVTAESGIEFFKKVKQQIHNSPELLGHCLI